MNGSPQKLFPRTVCAADRFAAVLLLLVLSLATSLTFAQEAKLAAPKQSQIEAAVARFMASTHVPGVAVAVVENGRYEWAQGFGLADVENNVPASEHTLFRLASISKPLTATAALLLWERGRLDLDAPVQNYCPAFPQKPWPISTRQVLGHLGGIRHYKSNAQDDPEIGNTKHFDDPIQAGLNFFKDDPLVAQPGTSFHYSTQGYTLVGCVIEGALGGKYVDFMRQNIFTPAGMEQTQVDDRFAIIPYRTRFYEKQDSGAVRNADFLDSSWQRGPIRTRLGLGRRSRNPQHRPHGRSAGYEYSIRHSAGTRCGSGRADQYGRCACWRPGPRNS
jgi:CubicO group peptidase (beta-lactamase class C family)